MWHVALLLGMALAQGGNIDVEFITWGMPQHEGLHDVSVVGPATEFALQELHKDLQPAVDFKQTFIMNNSWTSCKDVDADMSARLSEYYYKRQAVPSATILVAGGCEERRKVNELAANWNILYFTSGYNDPVIHEKDITPTWISVEPFNRDSLVRRTVDVLHFFKWSTIFIITTEHTAAFCLDVRDEVVRLMSKTLDKFQYSQATIDLDSPHSRISWCQQVRVSSRGTELWPPFVEQMPGDDL
ncbi:hypothetical protein RvY_11834 [Ramazzottius varieornatus]|uniref:Receptor ligand binding region domain-containing protein n=1 Tax=Ramazzottius varieornatus TaxID=947166 RepID=A0A1D1VHD3_RAMVA|nr:hypothetical protein RvY_11834 [Ramazzottius varieornatus]